MSQLAQAAVGVAILDPSVQKRCPWSLCSGEAPAAGVTLCHPLPCFSSKGKPKTFPALATTPKLDART